MARADVALQPLLVFDGDCGFCTACTDWLAARLARQVRIEPYQVLDLGDLGLAEADVSHYAWWLDGEIRARGHRAIGHALRACRAPWPLLGRLILTPPFSWLGRPVYRLVARLRGYLPGTTPACKRPGGP